MITLLKDVSLANLTVSLCLLSGWSLFGEPFGETSFSEASLDEASLDELSLDETSLDELEAAFVASCSSLMFEASSLICLSS